jgi:hypothetical protein
MTLSDIAARITGEGSMAKYTGGRASPTRDEIARLAYHFYETRGRCDGHESMTGFPPNRSSHDIIGRRDLTVVTSPPSSSQQSFGLSQVSAWLGQTGCTLANMESATHGKGHRSWNSSSSAARGSSDQSS